MVRGKQRLIFTWCLLLWSGPFAAAQQLGVSATTLAARQRGTDLGKREVGYFEVSDVEGSPLTSDESDHWGCQHFGDGCGSPAAMGCCNGCGDSRQATTYYAEMQVMFLRPHMLEEAVGKLSEKYEFSPRFILGYEGPAGMGGRVRYWTFGRTTPNLTEPEDPLRLKFDIIDLEGTYRLGTSRVELEVGGGFRWATMEAHVGDDSIGAEMPGITFSADARGLICRDCCSAWTAVAGARWAILGGDWQGDDLAFLESNRDDNMFTHEFYGGFEYTRHFGQYDLFARFVFEVQNWHSDNMSQTGTTDSISFVGPGLHIGAAY